MVLIWVELSNKIYSFVSFQSQDFCSGANKDDGGKDAFQVNWQSIKHLMITNMMLFYRGWLSHSFVFVYIWGQQTKLFEISTKNIPNHQEE